MLKLRTYSGYKSPREMKHVGEVPERDPPPYGRGNSSIRMYICDRSLEGTMYIFPI